MGRTIAMIVAPLALIAALAWLTVEHLRLREEVRLSEQCTRAAPSASASIDACPIAVKDRIETARRADQCEAALAKSNLSAIRATCGASVKLVAAERDAARADLSDARDQLAAAGRDRDAAVTRAEARQSLHASRTAHNEMVIARAPIGADGRARCDDDCLRALADAAPRDRR
ncbi:hypothetical protein [Sphingomonas sp.]|uniref:hypothetical protein n=1 Tax=Sphingomonas sp. TaxID=28214 RepID=UPI0031D1BBB3